MTAPVDDKGRVHEEHVRISLAAFRTCIRLVLNYVWDPIGIGRLEVSKNTNLNDGSDVSVLPMSLFDFERDSLNDEYDAYVPHIEALLLQYQPRQVIFVYLKQVESELMEVKGCESSRNRATDLLHSFIFKTCAPA